MQHIYKITHICGHEELMTIEAETEEEGLKKGEIYADEICLSCMNYHCFIFYSIHGTHTPQC